VPFLQKTYPVSTWREDTAIAGFSMGGVQALNFALFHPEMFGYVFPMSTGYFPAGIKQMEQDNAAVLQNVAAHPFKQFIIGRGKDDKLVTATSTATLQMLDDFKIPHKYIELTGCVSPKRRTPSEWMTFWRDKAKKQTIAGLNFGFQVNRPRRV